MSAGQGGQDDTLEALERLSGSAGDSRGSVRASLPTEHPDQTQAGTRPASNASDPWPPAPRPPASDRAAVSAPEGRMPPYRCLRCGYPLPTGGELRCAECGHAYDRDTVESWFSGEEQARFEHVLWLVVAGLFLRLLVLPQLLLISRLGSAVVIGWACYLAYRGKQESTGGYYGLAGMIAAGLMFFVFSWQKSALPFHTLDMIAGCLLLLAMLHDPSGVGVGAVTGGQRLAFAILFGAPVLAVACYVCEQAADASLASGNPFLSLYPPFGLLVPYLAAGGVWLFVWRTLAGIRHMLFGPPGE